MFNLMFILFWDRFLKYLLSSFVRVIQVFLAEE